MDDHHTFNSAWAQLYGGTANPLRLAWRRRAEAECFASAHQDPRRPTWLGSVVRLGAMAGAAVLSLAGADAARADDAAAPAAVAATSPAGDARATDASSHSLGQHPAIIVQRLQATAGYDYASKFYPHPAWLFLSATSPANAAPASEAVAVRSTLPKQ